jgi:RNA polymerase sigma factor (sigma-70 family)
MTAAAAAAFAPASTLDELFAAEYARVVAIARRIVADANEAEDVAQDVFADLAGRRPPYAPSWLYAAAVHRALNAVRSRKRRAAREQRTHRLLQPLAAAARVSDDPAAALERRDDERAIRAAMRRLRKRDAALLALRYGGDLSYREIAAVLHVPPAHVGTLLARAQTALAREMHRRADFPIAESIALVVLALALALATTPLRTYATALFHEFRPARFAASFVSGADPRKVYEQSALGQLHRAATYRRTAPLTWTRTTLRDATARTGYHVRVPVVVPDELRGAGNAYVAAPSSWTLQFDAATARSNGLHLPRSLEGATITSSLGSQIEIRYGHGTVYRIGPFGAPVVIVYEIPVPALAVRGATLGAIARWFASEPTVPAGAVRQLRSFDDPLPSIPVPVRIDRDRAKHVTVDGTDGLAITMPLAQSSGVVWEKDGVVYAVGGTYSLDRVLEIANSLR